MDISKFCGTTHAGYNTEEPFVVNGYKYATNGWICVRIPTDEPPKPLAGRERYLSVESIFTEPCEESEFFLLERDPETKSVPTSCDCEIECPQCKGEGSQECPECYSTVACDQCDGDGLVFDPQCPDCQGSGKAVMIYRRLGLGWIPQWHFDLLLTLDISSIWIAQANTIRFRFPGGEGAVALHTHVR